MFCVDCGKPDPDRNHYGRSTGQVPAWLHTDPCLNARMDEYHARETASRDAEVVSFTFDSETGNVVNLEMFAKKTLEKI